MFRKTMFAPLLAASAMALTVTPAWAGKADRAREAIAAAEAKIHTAEMMGASSELPHEAADARASLAMAREKLSDGHKSDSIAEAIHAQELADTAIGLMQRRKDQAVADAQRSRNDVATAQQQAADASRRADMAQQQAANSAADAAAARNAAIAAQNQHAQVKTTVTTQQPAPASKRTAARHTTTTVRRTVVAPATTTTTVQQGVN
jgi:hypothetical protein